MDGWLKGLVALACVVVIAGGVWFAGAEYRDFRDRQAAAEAKDRAIQASANRQAAFLKETGCRSEVDAVTKLHATSASPVVPDELLSRLKVCAAGDFYWPWERSELERLGLKQYLLK